MYIIWNLHSPYSRVSLKCPQREFEFDLDYQNRPFQITIGQSCLSESETETSFVVHWVINKALVSVSDMLFWALIRHLKRSIELLNQLILRGGNFFFSLSRTDGMWISNFNYFVKLWIWDSVHRSAHLIFFMLAASKEHKNYCSTNIFHCCT